MTLEAGFILTPTTKGEISREQLKAYAAASGDHNPIHLDDQFARDAGFPSVIAHGMLSMAFLGDFTVQHFPSARLLSIKTRFKRITVPGDTISCTGKIKHVGTDGTVTLSLATLNQRGEETTTGEATVLLNV